ncbi:helix-turn-helix domain-containing protein [Campylobacter jejuni]|nr:helix-turn-helix domain-containing protein [Campylobacter jejuni]EAL7061392.1 helix-turn-helix domain-containing protein [Campylobacter jejuni]
MKLGNKIKEAREFKQLTQNELVKISGVSRASLQLYEADKGNITLENLEKIANALEIDITYFVSPSNVSKSTNFVSYSSPNTNLESQTLNDDIINIPFFENVRASAGSGTYNDDESNQTLSLSKSFLRECFGLYSFINLSVILGQGDSMVPTLPENCYLLVQQGEVKEGEICVTRIEDELYVKRLQKRPKLKLLSDNKAYEPISLDGEDFEILGRVVGYFKKTTL